MYALLMLNSGGECKVYLVGDDGVLCESDSNIVPLYRRMQLCFSNCLFHRITHCILCQFVSRQYGCFIFHLTISSLCVASVFELKFRSRSPPSKIHQMQQGAESSLLDFCARTKLPVPLISSRCISPADSVCV